MRYLSCCFQSFPLDFFKIRPPQMKTIFARQCGIFYCVTALLDGASKISKFSNKMFDFTSAT